MEQPSAPRCSLKAHPLEAVCKPWAPGESQRVSVAKPWHLQAYGVHINGYVVGAQGQRLWLARRSASKPTWPGMLDHIVAGGQVGWPARPLKT